MPTVTVTATGAGNFVIPAGVTSIVFEAWGAGGGSANLGTANEPGGGGGAYISATISVTPGDIIYYQVGSGVAATAGGSSWFQKNVNSSTNAWRANGGGVAVAGGGNGGTPVNGLIGVLINAFQGGQGGAAQGGGGSRGGAGGGGSAGPLGNGGAGVPGSGSSGGSGGVGNFGSSSANVANEEGAGGGNGGNGGATGNGGLAAACGGGAGGSGSSSTATTSGGRGQIRYTYTAVTAEYLYKGAGNRSSHYKGAAANDSGRYFGTKAGIYAS